MCDVTASKQGYAIASIAQHCYAIGAHSQHTASIPYPLDGAITTKYYIIIIIINK